MDTNLIQRTSFDIRTGITRVAIFSPCEKYRYSLRVTWDSNDENDHILNAIMLNPSTADEVKNDPTVERISRRAQALGYFGYEITNLFAYRATDPREMKKVDDPIGPDNDDMLRNVATTPGVLVVCGWGNHGSYRDRAETVAIMLQNEGVDLNAFKLNKGNVPAHPLYVPYAHKMRPWSIDI